MYDIKERINCGKTEKNNALYRRMEKKNNAVYGRMCEAEVWERKERVTEKNGEKGRSEGQKEMFSGKHNNPEK